jgi:protein-S-isoprenylcysteine O-methyltransferase Ste14
VTVKQVLILVGILYGGSEVVLAFLLRSRDNVARGADRGSLTVLWVTITLAIVAAIQVEVRHPGPLPGPVSAWVAAGLALLLAGLALRWTAILTLRGAFTVDVAIAPGQRLVRRGPYRRLRHPAYTGSLLAFLGMAVLFADWLAALTLFLPIAAAFLYRVRVEERALRSAFGGEYEAYARQTCRLVPFLY